MCESREDVSGSVDQNNIIYRCGLPQLIIADTAKHVNNDVLDALCAQFRSLITIQRPTGRRWKVP